MTANAVLNESAYPPEQHLVDPAGERLVKIIKSSFAPVERKADEMAQHFYAVLFSVAPDTRDLFPVNMQTQRSRLFRALVHLVQMVDRPQELTPFLRQLGKDHRKFGVRDEHFDALGVALRAAVRKFTTVEWTDEVDQAWAQAYEIMARTMQEGAADDDAPAWWAGHVVDHERIDWDTAIIRVQPEPQMQYVPGQYVSIESPHRPRLWRYLSPANAPREDGLMEFHVRVVPDGWVSRALVRRTAPGEVWRLGAPMGNLWVNRNAQRDIVMIAGGTGVAPMCSVIDDLAQRDRQPSVTLFFGGRNADSLYYLPQLRQWEADHPWLTVVPVTEDGSVEGGKTGTLAEIVPAYGGAWHNHDVLVAGSPGMIRATVSRMLVAGTAYDQISYDSFTTE